MYSVYLAGPIKGLPFGTSNDWRVEVASRLAPEITSFSPMRGKEYGDYAQYKKEVYDVHPLSTGKAIVSRDMFDVMRVDLIFINLLGATYASIGTMIEVGWASMMHKPILLVMEEENVHDHGMLKSIVGWRTDNLEEAVDLTKHILLPG